MSTIQRGDVYAYRSDSKSYVVADRVDGEIVYLIGGFPRKTITTPRKTFDRLFDAGPVAEHTCYYDNCLRKTALRTLRGEYACIEHLPDVSEFLVPGESSSKVLETLHLLKCPGCTIKEPILLVEVNYNTPQVVCSSCKQRYILSGIDNPRMLEILAQCDRAFVYGNGGEYKVQQHPNASIRKAIFTRTKFVTESILWQDENRGLHSAFVAINPNVQVKFSLKDVHITTYTPNFVCVQQNSEVLKVPMRDFQETGLDPSEVVAHCNKVTEVPPEGLAHLGSKVVLKVLSNASFTQSYQGLDFESRNVSTDLKELRVSLNFLKLFEYRKSSRFLWDDLI